MSSHFGLGHINGSWDCTESKFAQDMFGLTKGQIQILDAVVNPNGSPRGPDILKDLKFMRIVPQQFATDGDWSTEVMFSMAEVLDVIRLRSSRTRDVEASVIRFEKPLGAKTAVTVRPLLNYHKIPCLVRHPAKWRCSSCRFSCHPVSITGGRYVFILCITLSLIDCVSHDEISREGIHPFRPDPTARD